MTYLFFIKKASLVSGFEKGVIFRRVGQLTKYSLLIFIPFFVVPVAISITRGITTAEGVCVLQISQLWFPALFIFGNIALSAALLFLFVTPLRHHARKTASVNTAVSKQMLRVANRNARLAYIMTIVATLSVVGTCIVTALSLQDQARYDYILMYSYTSTVIDLVISTICARMMTHLWMPSWIKPVNSSDQVSNVSSENAQGSHRLSPYQPSKVLDGRQPSKKSSTSQPGQLNGVDVPKTGSNPSSVNPS